MHEFQQLSNQVTKYKHATTDRQRQAIAKSIVLWGGRLHRWADETAGLLGRQLIWLDKNDGTAPTADKRFAEWTDLLRQYEAACDLLHAAEVLMNAPIDRVAA